MSNIHVTHRILTRVTSVRALGSPGADGRAPAEDMHGIPCFIDTRTRLDVDAEPRAGHIFEASIDPMGWIVAARRVDRQPAA